MLKDLLKVAQEESFSTETQPLDERLHGRPPHHHITSHGVSVSWKRPSSRASPTAPSSKHFSYSATRSTPTHLTHTLRHTHHHRHVQRRLHSPSPDVSLKSWLQPFLDPDLLILCFQEVDTSSAAYSTTLRRARISGPNSSRPPRPARRALSQTRLQTAGGVVNHRLRAEGGGGGGRGGSHGKCGCGVGRVRGE